MALHAGSHDLAREQLLLVCHRNKVTSVRDTRQERYYRRLYYTNEYDLLVSLQQSSQFPPQVKETFMVDDAVKAIHGPASDQESTHENIQQHDIEEELQDYDGSAQDIPVMQTTPLTDEELEAGSTIRNAYKKYLRRKATSTNSSVRLTGDAFMECLEQSRTIEWPRRSLYKLLYLGPLPNLLACLQCVWADIMDKRAEARKMFRNGLEPDKIDQANADLTELS